MIKGLSSLDLSSMAGAINRLKSAGPPPRSTQPMPGQDTFQSVGSGSAAEAPAVSLNDGVKIREAVYERPVQLTLARPPSTPAANEPSDNRSMMDRMRDAFFTGTGDEAFDSTVDLNSDGRIDYSDLNLFEQQLTPMLERMSQSFFLNEGDEAFDAEMDMNQDGAIDFSDLAMLQTKLTFASSEDLQPAPSASIPPQEMNIAAASTTDQLRVDPNATASPEPAPAATVGPQYMNTFAPDAAVELGVAKDDLAEIISRKRARF